MEDLTLFLKDNKIDYELNVPTKNLVSFRIGGNASIVIYPSKTGQIQPLIQKLNDRSIRYVVLGNGTNCFFSDKGFDGAVISTVLLNRIAYCGDGIIFAECGVPIIKCCELALEHSLTGLEFAYGIPGNVGGCIYMNASAFNKDMSFLVYKTSVLNTDTGKISELDISEHQYSKKHSVFMGNRNLLILSSLLQLNKGKKDEISNEMKQNFDIRNKSQPMDYPSAGSVFKRPSYGFASKYIDDAGLKGFRYGDAIVSCKHAGFILNLNNASSCDVLKLISYIKEIIYKKFRVSLEEEIIYFE